MKKPTDMQMMQAAFDIHHRDGEVEVDVMPMGKKYMPKARISRAKGNPDKGAYVLAWVWVTDEDALAFAKDAKKKAKKS